MSIELNRHHHVDSKDEKQLSNYQFEETIGQGNFGKVKLATFTPTNKQYAVKILNKVQIEKKNEMHLIQRELNIIKQFNHFNVIYVHQIIEDNLNYFIIMDYCENGELFDYIVRKRRLSEEEASVLFYQLINGMEYIHLKHIAHRDLKPENLLLTKNKILKIIDFGLSSFCGEDTLLSTKCGSPSYASPEIIKGELYDGFKNDIWCCGIILYAMLCGFLPFEGNGNKELFKNILQCKIEFPDFVSQLGAEMVLEMLHPQPEKRIQINEIKTRKFYLKGKESVENILIKKQNKIKGLHIINSNSALNAFRKPNFPIDKSKFNSPKSETISAKIEEILKTDASLYHNLKTISLSTCSSSILTNEILSQNFCKLFGRKLKPKFPLKQILENRLIMQQKTENTIVTNPNKKPFILIENGHQLTIPKKTRKNTHSNHSKDKIDKIHKIAKMDKMTKMDKIKNECLPPEPKQFNEFLKINFAKYINTKTSESKRKQLNNKFSTQCKINTSAKALLKFRSQSKEDKNPLSNKRVNYLPKLTNNC